MLRGVHRFLLLPAVEIVTVGAPFCAFKLLTGKLLLASSAWWWCVGAALVALGVIDVALNAVNLVALALGRERPVAVCTLAGAVGALRRENPGFSELGTSIDVLLSFTLVASMVWTGAIGSLGADLARAWAACTVLNVLGAGLGRVARALDTLTGTPEGAARDA